MFVEPEGDGINPVCSQEEAAWCMGAAQLFLLDSRSLLPGTRSAVAREVM